MSKQAARESRTQRWLLENVLVQGFFRYPAAEDLDRLCEPRADESQEDARRRVIGGFGDAAAECDRRAAAAMTAAGFSLAITGLLLNSDVARGVLVLLALVSLLGFGSALWAHHSSVDRSPGAEEDRRNIEDAHAICIRKHFWTILGQTLVFFALLGYGIVILVIAVTG